MIDSTINDDKMIVGGEDMILAGRYHILRRLGQDYADGWCVKLV